MERRLAAILATDVVGYSRMIRADEEGTLAALQALRADLIDPKLAEHHGRIVKLMGDGMLAEFPSVVDAVRAAVETQQAVAEHNADLPEDKRIEFRVGINLGDVVIDGDDIQGDGVNVAARLEGMAEPGGICISGGVHEQVRDRIDIPFKDLGEQEVKNISRPVRVWQWLPTAPATANPAIVDMPLALPDKPSIAVLPFVNMSGDPEQEYFSDGMTEEIITALSRLNWLFVIARNSTFAFKGKSADIREIARDLGVRYVLEGSVRKSGERLRISGQLIDATTGTHLWAGKFDGNLADVFALQDEMTENVISAIEPNLRRAERQRSKRKRPENLQAYDFYLRALPYLYAFRPEPNATALRLLEQAVAAQPDFAPALANLAWALEQRFVHHWPNAEPEDPVRAIEIAKQAIAADRSDADATSLGGFLLTMLAHDHESGQRAIERALEINPNSATVCWTAGWVYLFCGEAKRALELAERLIRLSPVDMEMHFILNVMGMAYLFLRRFDEAAEISARSLDYDDGVDVVYWIRTPACAHLGQSEDVAKAVSALLNAAPNFSISGFRKQVPFRNPEHMQIIVDGFRLAGLPE